MWSILPCTECAPRATTTWTTTRTTTSRTSTSSTVFISIKLVFGNALTANSSESVCGCVRGNNLNLDFHRCRSQTATLFNSSDMMIYRFFDRTRLTCPGQTVDVHVHVTGSLLFRKHHIAATQLQKLRQTASSSGKVSWSARKQLAKFEVHGVNFGCPHHLQARTVLAETTASLGHHYGEWAPGPFFLSCWHGKMKCFDTDSDTDSW